MDVGGAGVAVGGRGGGGSFGVLEACGRCLAVLFQDAINVTATKHDMILSYGC